MNDTISDTYKNQHGCAVGGFSPFLRVVRHIIRLEQIRLVVHEVSQISEYENWTWNEVINVDERR
jgi:hypothetical protein